MPHDTLLNRLRAEFLEMPGLRLQPEQVQRLCGVDRTLCQMVLDMLVDEKFLCVKLDGHYARLADEEMSRPRAWVTDDADGPRPHPAKADLGNEYRKRSA